MEKNKEMKVQTTLKESVAFITFYNPPVNALPTEVLRDLAVHIESAGAEKGVRSIVLQSEGRVFCAGASFDELIKLQETDEAKEFFMGFAHVILAMRSAPKPVIVRVQGKTVGGGNGLVAAADFGVAVESAAFKLSELSIGIGPYVIGPAIIRKTGIAFFQQMSFSPWRWFSAFEVKRAGLLTHVTENMKRVDEIIEEITSAYEKYDEEAVAMLKAEIWKDTAGWEKVLEEQAEKSASLLLRKETKAILEKLKGK